MAGRKSTAEDAVLVPLARFHQGLCRDREAKNVSRVVSRFTDWFFFALFRSALFFSKKDRKLGIGNVRLPDFRGDQGFSTVETTEYNRLVSKELYPFSHSLSSSPTRKSFGSFHSFVELDTEDVDSSTVYASLPFLPQ